MTCVLMGSYGGTGSINLAMAASASYKHTISPSTGHEDTHTPVSFRLLMVLTGSSLLKPLLRTESMVSSVMRGKAILDLEVKSVPPLPLTDNLNDIRVRNFLFSFVKIALLLTYFALVEPQVFPFN